MREPVAVDPLRIERDDAVIYNHDDSFIERVCFLEAALLPTEIEIIPGLLRIVMVKEPGPVEVRECEV